MSPSALRGITNPNPEPGPVNQMPSRGELCPDVLAVARDLGVTRARDLRHLQTLYDRYTAYQLAADERAAKRAELAAEQHRLNELREMRALMMPGGGR
mgnify:CR=1 FL=1